MVLKDIDFGVVLGQSGVQGFFGEGDEYPHHRWYKFIPGFSMYGLGFVAKTTGVDSRIYPEKSNTELEQIYKLKRFLPKSIWVSVRSFFGGYMLNAMGIPTPGAKKLFTLKKLQKRKEPFQLSYMPEGKMRADKIQDAMAFAHLVEAYLHPDYYQYGMQVNFSCPNTEHEKDELGDIIAILQELRKWLPKVPLIPKFDLMIKPKIISELKEYCDAFCIGNSLGFGSHVNGLHWDKLFKDSKSPLTKHFDGKFKGGLSGRPLFPVLVDWLEEMQEYDSSVKIIAGGGIMKKADITTLSKFSIVKAVALGSVATLRPWRMRGLINHARKLFVNRK